MYIVKMSSANWYRRFGTGRVRTFLQPPDDITGGFRPVASLPMAGAAEGPYRPKARRTALSWYGTWYGTLHRFHHTLYVATRKQKKA
jgi:hypothetical protein